MRLTTILPVGRAAGTSAAVTLGLLLGVGITAHTHTRDHAQNSGAVQAPDAQDPPGQEPTAPPQQPGQPGQPPPPGDPSQPGQAEQEAKPPQLTISGDAAIVFYQVLPDKTSQFEQVMNKVKDAMQQSDNPVRKQQAAGMRMLKSQKPSDDGTMQYILFVHPVMKDTEYEPGMLVYETFPSDANKLFADFGSLVKQEGSGLMELDQVLEFGSGAPGGGGGN